MIPKEKKIKSTYGWNRVSKNTNRVLSALFIILSLAAVLPMIFITIVSFSSEGSIAAKGYSFFPDSWSLDAYRYMLRSIDYISHSFLLSAVLTAAGTLLSLALISTMAFAISQPGFRFRKLFTVLVIIPMFFSGGLAASYFVNTQLFGLKDSFFALLLPGACSSWYVMVMSIYFRNNIPRELIESASIDGASLFRIFFRIVLPLSKPILITIGLFQALGYWNSWYYAMLYISANHRELFPLQYVLYNLQKNVEFMAANENISGAVIAKLPIETFRMAVVVLIVLPIIISYPFIKKTFIRGLLSGSIKE